MTPTRRRRPGWSLLEVLVVMSGLAALMTIAAGLIFQMLRVGQAERSRVVASTALERLARDLRGDARASEVPPDLAPARLALRLPGGRSVEYTLDGRGALRTVLAGGKVERRESYRWPRGTSGRFEPAGGPAGSITLAIAPDTVPGPERAADPSYRGYRIEAIPGRDARLGAGGGR